MIRGLYTAASGMMAQQNRNDILSNNLANVETPGYQTKQGMVRAFPEVLVEALRVPGQGDNSIGTLNTGVFIEESRPVFSQGDLMDTGVSSHMAIYDGDLPANSENGAQSKLFFTVEDKDGNRYYTRSGLFTEDASGQLVTPEGHLVLDDWSYPIDVNGRSYTIDDKGNLNFSDGESIRLGLTKINDLTLLENRGNQNYAYVGDAGTVNYVEEGENYSIYQGRLERSNVDVNQTVTDMNTALRLYEANQKVIQAIDSTLDKAVNEVGRV